MSELLHSLLFACVFESILKIVVHLFGWHTVKCFKSFESSLSRTPPVHACQNQSSFDSFVFVPSGIAEHLKTKSWNNMRSMALLHLLHQVYRLSGWGLNLVARARHKEAVVWHWVEFVLNEVWTFVVCWSGLLDSEACVYLLQLANWQRCFWHVWTGSWHRTKLSFQCCTLQSVDSLHLNERIQCCLQFRFQVAMGSSKFWQRHETWMMKMMTMWCLGSFNALQHFQSKWLVTSEQNGLETKLTHAT